MAATHRSTLIAAASFIGLLYIAPAQGLLLFFLASAPLVWLRKKMPDPMVTVYQLGCVAFWIILLYFYIDIQQGVLGALEIVREKLSGEQAGKDAAGAAISSLGASYCFLRAVYALRERQMTLWGYFRYYFFIPTFFLGPIMPPDLFLKQIPRISMDGFREGTTRIVMGTLRFLTSAVLALMIPVSDAELMSINATGQSPLSLWFLTFLTGIWLYLNFSGASEMAIGAARLVGIHVPENFNNPFAATNLVDFWRSWHITLGDWLRANVFNPFIRLVGGNSTGARGMFSASLVTMVVCGLWHHFTYSFFVWGIMHGGGLAFNQAWSGWGRPMLGVDILENRLYKMSCWLITHAYVTLAWSFFFPAINGDISVSLAYMAKLLYIL
ncbi:MAG: hypothetical protein OEZ28_03215 [Nitrospinota bacterium]|nr:hypothetical protein [Nitrospinota bacterium]